MDEKNWKKSDLVFTKDGNHVLVQDVDTATIKVMTSKRTDCPEATRTQIGCVRCGFRELCRLHPMQCGYEDLYMTAMCKIS